VLNPNGHHRGGKAATYKQARCANLARRGMLALNFEFIGQSELEADSSHNQQAHLSMAGMSGVGLFYLAMRKGLDVLLDHPHADTSRVAMTGLSGGGWQTIILSALDTRITASIPVAGYTAVRARVESLADVGDYEQDPPDLAAVADYDTMTAMLAPRPTMIVFNENDDCCFKTERAKPVVYDAVTPTFNSLGAADRFAWHSNTDPGTHNYAADNRAQLYRFLDRHFGMKTPPQDLHDGVELFTESELRVGLPPEQTTMIEMARRRARNLARSHRTPRTSAQKQKLRQRLREVIRLPEYRTRILEETPLAGGWQATVQVGPWRLPVTCGKPAENGIATLAVSILGRQGLDFRQVNQKGYYAADLLGQGVLKTDHRWLMLVECAGQRILGIQAAQLLALSAVVAKHAKADRIRLEGHGEAAAFLALLVAGLEPARFRRVIAYSSLQTLSLLSEWNTGYEAAQPLFCPRLLEVADVPQIQALLDGVAYEQPARCVLPE
jgi:dienelactone hydrolase